jgi:hypothetical protein
MLHAKKDITYIYVFIKIMPALTIVIFTVTGNDITVKKSLKKIVSEAAYTALAPVLTQARNSLIDLIAA